MNYKQILDDVLASRTINQTTVRMTTNLTVRDDGFHEKILFLDPTGLTRTVIPLGSWTTGYTIIIFNTTGTGNIIFDPNNLAATVYKSDPYGPGEFTYNGTTWEKRSAQEIVLTMDSIADGDTYGKVLLTDISAGHITLASCVGTLDDIVDGGSYGKVDITQLSGSRLSIESIDNVGNLASSNSIGTLNHILNGDFVSWGTGSTTNAGEWIEAVGVTARTESSPSPKMGKYCMALTASVGSPCQVYQTFSSAYGINYWKGREITLGADVYCDADLKARIGLWDGVSWTYGSFHTGSSSWERLSFTTTISSSATTLQFYMMVEPGSAQTAYFDCCSSYEGDIDLPFVASGISNAQSTGTYVTSSYIAILRNGVAKSWLDNTGSLYLIGDGLSSTTFRFYGTISGSYGAGDLFIGSTTSGQGSIWFDMSSATMYLDGDFVLLNSGDIHFLGSASASGASKIMLHHGSSLASTCSQIWCDTGTPPVLYITPDSDNDGYLLIGSSSYSWNSIRMYAGSGIVVYAETSFSLNSGYLNVSDHIRTNYLALDDDISTPAVIGSRALIYADGGTIKVRWDTGTIQTFTVT